MAAVKLADIVPVCNESCAFFALLKCSKTKFKPYLA
jgi:hypothetical protein